MVPQSAQLLEQSGWWILPYLALMLVMLHAMMEFTVSLLVKRPSKRQPVPGAELRQRLLALNQPDQAHPLIEGQDCDLEIKWFYEDTRRSHFAISRQASATHLRFLLDEQRLRLPGREREGRGRECCRRDGGQYEEKLPHSWFPFQLTWWMAVTGRMRAAR